jgi:hypothetical protein
MKQYMGYRRTIIVICIILPFFVIAQPDTTGIDRQKDLFGSDSIIDITLRGNIHALLNDRSDNPSSYPISLSYRQGGEIKIIPVTAKTRGHFRKAQGNCDYPPLLIQFVKKDIPANSLFNESVKLKLVMPCQGEEYVVREWLVYKIYNLVTPESFRARLIRVKLEDEHNKKEHAPFYGILLEEEKQMARRNHMVTVSHKINPEQIIPEIFFRMAVFEYLIGNTDWSVQYLQNIKLIAPDSLAVPTAVPYDFDHAGIVNTPYAEPAEALQLSSIRERRFRGYCVTDMTLFDSTLTVFNRLKNDIYHLYTGCPLLDPKYVKSTLQFLDAFYNTINNPKSLQKEFGYPCNKNGTGNVIIKGLKED